MLNSRNGYVLKKSSIRSGVDGVDIYVREYREGFESTYVDTLHRTAHNIPAALVYIRDNLPAAPVWLEVIYRLHLLKDSSKDSI